MFSVWYALYLCFALKLTYQVLQRIWQSFLGSIHLCWIFNLMSLKRPILVEFGHLTGDVAIKSPLDPALALGGLANVELINFLRSR